MIHFALVTIHVALVMIIPFSRHLSKRPTNSAITLEIKCKPPPKHPHTLSSSPILFLCGSK